MLPGGPLGSSGGGGGGADATALKIAENLADLDDAEDARTNLGLRLGVDVQPYSENGGLLASGSLLGLRTFTKQVVAADLAALAVGVKAVNIPWVTLPATALFDRLDVPNDGAGEYFDANGANPTVTISAGIGMAPDALLSARRVDAGSMIEPGPLTPGVAVRDDIGGFQLVVRIESDADLNTMNVGDVKLRLFAFAG